MSDRDPAPPGPEDNEPMWQSDIAEREARRRRMMVFGGSAVAILVGFVGLYAALSWVAGSLTTDTSGVPTTEVAISDPDAGDAQPPPSQDPATGVPIQSAADLDWYAIDSPLGFSNRLLTSRTGDFYALSTIPGNANVWPAPKAIYKSGDGENWDIISLDDSHSGHDMALVGNSIYLIGTAPANQDHQEPPQVLISSSDDDGSSWTQAMLPTISGPPGGAPLQWANVTMKLAANIDTVVAVVQSQYFLDYRQLVPPEFVGDSYGYNPQADGVQVVDHMLLENLYLNCEQEASSVEFDELSDECRALFNGDQSAGAIGVVTWEEMGLPGGEQPMFSEMFVSSANAEFEVVESPFTPGADISAFHGSAGGFIGVEWDRNVQRVWWSEDGRSWEQDAGLSDFDWITNIGMTGGQTVVVGQGRDAAMAAWRTESGDWDVVDINGALGEGALQRHISAAAVGPLGVAVVFQGFDERAGIETSEVAIGTGPDSWSLLPIEQITGMGGGYSDWVTVGTDRILLRYQVFNDFRPRSLQVIGSVVEET